MRVMVIGLICCLLSGCGFHLRGSVNPVALPFTQVSLQPNQPQDKFWQTLSTMLNAHDINIDDDTAWRMHFTPLALKTFPLAYGPNGELVREKLELSTQIQLMHHGQMILEKKLKGQRQHQLNIATSLANAQEQEMILQEMQHDLAGQFLLQIVRLECHEDLCQSTAS
jgi:outer membrane lipopolysaccharide assembly protein LptE/RlpB